MTAQRQTAAELTIGIVGPHDLVERIMLSGTVQPGVLPGDAGQPGTGSPVPSANGVSAAPARRLVAAASQRAGAGDKVLRLGAGIDACLFASQVPHEYARRAGTLRVPATYVPLAGSALYAALAAGQPGAGPGPEPGQRGRAPPADVEDAFGELGVPTDNVHVREDAANAATLAAFHERLWRRDEITVAFTCLQSVAQRLSAADVPVRILRPTSSAIRVRAAHRHPAGGQPAAGGSPARGGPGRGAHAA